MTDLKNRRTKTRERFFKQNRKSYLIFTGMAILFLLFSGTANAQEVKRLDKVKAFFKDEYHSPTKAIVYSAIIPGWGQAYNRKYWKIPIVYVGFGAVGYFVKTNHDNYKLYKEYYQIMTDDPMAVPVVNKNIQQIRVDIDSFRRTRDLSFLGMFLWYGLNLIDANIDGHFYNYDVDDDLSMGLKPWISGYTEMNHGVGITLNLRWK